MRLAPWVLTLFLAGAGGAAAQSSTFQQTCHDIRLSVLPQGVQLTAICQNGSNGLVAASVDLRGIHNNDGTLEYRFTGPSTFQRSCTDIYLDIADDQVWLNAYCTAQDGSTALSTLEIRNVRNVMGQLSAG